MIRSTASLIPWERYSDRLRLVDAVVAWVLNLAVPLLAGLAWLAAVGQPAGWVVHSLLRIAAVLLLVGWMNRVRGVGLVGLRTTFGSSKRDVAMGVAIGLTMFAFEYGLVVGWQFVNRAPNIGDGTWNPWIATEPLAEPSAAYFVGLVLIGPLVEEFVHRGGVAFPAMANKIGVIGGALVSSAVFALGHQWLPFALLTSFVTGLAYAWMVHRYRSLAPALAAHVTVNFGVFASGWAFHNLLGMPGRSLG